MIYEIVGVVWAIIMAWCLWESYNTPAYPADWNEDGINPDYTEIDDDE
tara:strand:- start:276 stop:419 length:144 start_codon:yes stop_codon:yes gene_type:complete